MNEGGSKVLNLLVAYEWQNTCYYGHRAVCVDSYWAIIRLHAVHHKDCLFSPRGKYVRKVFVADFLKKRLKKNVSQHSVTKYPQTIKKDLFPSLIRRVHLEFFMSKYSMMCETAWRWTSSKTTWEEDLTFFFLFLSFFLFSWRDKSRFFLLL